MVRGEMEFWKFWIPGTGQKVSFSSGVTLWGKAKKIFQGRGWYPSAHNALIFVLFFFTASCALAIAKLQKSLGQKYWIKYVKKYQLIFILMMKKDKNLESPTLCENWSLPWRVSSVVNLLEAAVSFSFIKELFNVKCKVFRNPLQCQN